MPTKEDRAKQSIPVVGSGLVVMDVGSFTFDIIAGSVSTRQSVDQLLEKIQVGHRAVVNCHSANIQESFFRLVNIIEKQRLGLRFLPKQVTRKAIRKMRVGQKTEAFR